MTDRDNIQAVPHYLLEKYGGMDVFNLTVRKVLEEETIRQIEKGLVQMIAGESTPTVVVDLSGVEHLASAALGALILSYDKSKANGKDLAIVGLNPQVYEVFKITKLNKKFHIYGSLADAAARRNRWT